VSSRRSGSIVVGREKYTKRCGDEGMEALIRKAPAFAYGPSYHRPLTNRHNRPATTTSTPTMNIQRPMWLTQPMIVVG